MSQLLFMFFGICQSMFNFKIKKTADHNYKMKKIEQIQEIFKIFDDTSTKRSVMYKKEEDWEILLFRPYVKDNIYHYTFRIYGKVSGSIFPNYNNNLQWYGAVYYNYNTITNELTRHAYENILHEAITLHIDLNKLAMEL